MKTSRSDAVGRLRIALVRQTNTTRNVLWRKSGLASRFPPAPARDAANASVTALYGNLAPDTKKAALRILLKQYEILQSEKRMLQQIENASVALLVTGGTAALVAFAQVQAGLARDLVTEGPLAAQAVDAVKTATSAANLIVALVPVAMLAGGSFLVSMHARVRRVAAFCGYLESVINAVAAVPHRVIGWETLSIVMPRGRGWTFWLLASGLVLAVAIWFVFAQPLVDRGETRFDPFFYKLTNTVLLGVIGLAWISHRLDQRYYARAFPIHFGADWAQAEGDG